MAKKTLLLAAALVVVFACPFLHQSSFAAEPIVVGVPTSTGFLEGKEALKAVELAVEEINAAGGITVGSEKRTLKVESIDIRDAAPGVPVPEALLGLEKIILEKKPAALLVGPFRSEALMAGMDIIAKYKVPMIGTVAMSPASEAKVKEDPEKYKYIFRTCLNAKFLVKYLAGTMAHFNKLYGFDKVFIMNQDVAWARKTAEIMADTYFTKSGWTVVGSESYPTGTSDFSSALMGVNAKGAQVILAIFDMPQSGTLVKQWNAMKVPAVMAGFISPLAGPGAWKTFDGKIGGAINCNFEMGSAIASSKIPASEAFLAAYQKRWGEPIEAGHGISPAYDAVYILAEAITRARTTEADALVAALEKTDHDGAMGRCRFDSGHQAIFDMDPKEFAVAAVVQWTKDGNRKIVFPQTFSEADIQLPEGLKSLK
jgi:branched-chain amino acid transport system substrate-binding protein